MHEKLYAGDIGEQVIRKTSANPVDVRARTVQQKLEFRVFDAAHDRGVWGLASRTVVNMSRLSGKVAIVTGASKGIGGGIATALGAAGARVTEEYMENLTPHGIGGSRKHSVQIGRSADQGEVRKCLREVPQMATIGTQFLRIQS